MRLVQAPLPYPPRACAVTNREDGEMVDFNVVIDRPEATRLYLKTQIVEDAGRMLGMVPGKEVEELKSRMTELSKELDDVKETLSLAADFEEKLTPKEPVLCR